MDSASTDKIKEVVNGIVASVKANNPGLKQFKGSVKLKYGLPERIRFTFPKHYVFVEKGVGKGRKIDSGKTTPKPAINPAIEAGLPALSDACAQSMADMVVRNIFIK